MEVMWGTPPPPPPPRTDNKGRTKLTPTKYISLEAEVIEKSDSF